jgi:hypothetical protein
MLKGLFGITLRDYGVRIILAVLSLVTASIDALPSAFLAM